MVKKTYNPLKMWGSWVGLVISMVLPIIPIVGPGGTTFIKSIMNLDNYFINNTLLEFGLLIYPLILGFLLGYGLHSIIRVVRK